MRRRTKQTSGPIRRWLRPFGTLAITFTMLHQHVPLGAQGNSAKRDTSAFQQLPTLLVDLDQNGFHPAILRCKAGSVLLRIRNASGRKNVNFRFDRVGGPTLKSQSLDANTPDFRDAVTLTAGEYTVTSTHDKTATLRIVVQ